jgi:hypothetical protein
MVCMLDNKQGRKKSAVPSSRAREIKIWEWVG